MIGLAAGIHRGMTASRGRASRKMTNTRRTTPAPMLPPKCRSSGLWHFPFTGSALQQAASSRKPGREPGLDRIGGRDGSAQLPPPSLPPEIMQHAIRLYLRFTLSSRDVEELVAERGLDVSYETVRR